MRLAFAELGDDLELGAIVAAGRKYRVDLTAAEVLRVLERRPRRGESKYVRHGGRWRPRGAAVTKTQLAREERGLPELDAFVQRGMSAQRAVDDVLERHRRGEL